VSTHVNVDGTEVSIFIITISKTICMFLKRSYHLSMLILNTRVYRSSLSTTKNGILIGWVGNLSLRLNTILVDSIDEVFHI
jgi:hypothetical protein